MRKRRRPRGRITLVVAVLGGLALAALAARIWLFPSQGTPPMSAAATIGDVEESVLATGTLKPARLVAVGAQASGRITALKVALGQKVAKGDLVAEIDSVTQQNSLRTQQASLANLRAQRTEKEATLTLNQLTLTRQKAMAAQRAASQADLESAQAAVQVTQAQIEQLDAQIIEGQVAIETAQVDLGYTRITAPIDGTVLSIVSQEGQTVNAVQSTPTIVILGDLDVMTVRAEISEADIVKVRPGQPIYFTILGERGHRYEAVLDSIEPAPESIRNDSSFNTISATSSSSSSSSSTSQAVYYIGVFSVPNADNHLRTYMTAEIHIVLGEAKGVLTIPSAALGAKGADGTATVRVVDGAGKVAERRVTVGLDNGIRAEVRSGLSEGERVVTGEQGTAAAAADNPGPPPPPGG
ncbi:efflux transporter periplasmic adaptor subunit [Inquilinus limosus]|uniref:Efflux transporter periplasmic adaptor subunit n=1 Tax=Inquilinus limosus TaxID=171674 RepID=A0A211ZFE2_9PROT|nr:efflux transporter periplasmic adaptor subunit [Inquilinus limosus]